MTTITQKCNVCSGTGQRPNGGGPQACYQCSGLGTQELAAVDVSEITGFLKEAVELLNKIYEIVAKGKK